MGEIGELSQKIYDTITGIQLGKSEDTKNWIPGSKINKTGCLRQPVLFIFYGINIPPFGDII